MGLQASPGGGKSIQDLECGGRRLLAFLNTILSEALKQVRAFLNPTSFDIVFKSRQDFALRRDAVSPAAVFAPVEATAQKLLRHISDAQPRATPISPVSFLLDSLTPFDLSLDGSVQVTIVAYQHGIRNEILQKTSGRLKAMGLCSGEAVAGAAPVRMAFRLGVLCPRACHSVGAGATQHKLAASKRGRFMRSGHRRWTHSITRIHFPPSPFGYKPPFFVVCTAGSVPKVCTPRGQSPRAVGSASSAPFALALQASLPGGSSSVVLLAPLRRFVLDGPSGEEDRRKCEDWLRNGC